MYFLSSHKYPHTYKNKGFNALNCRIYFWELNFQNDLRVFHIFESSTYRTELLNYFKNMDL